MAKRKSALQNLVVNVTADKSAIADRIARAIRVGCVVLFETASFDQTRANIHFEGPAGVDPADAKNSELLAVPSFESNSIFHYPAQGMELARCLEEAGK